MPTTTTRTVTTRIALSARLAVAVIVASFAALALAPSAFAGQWIQVSCVNPDNSAAPSQGWSGFATMSPPTLSDAVTTCAPGAPLFALLSDSGPAAVGSSENLQYTPPSGSTLAGGSLVMRRSAAGPYTNASGIAVVYAPAFSYPAGVISQCAAGLNPCTGGTSTVIIPANVGGDLYVSAACGGNNGFVCNGSAGGSYASAYVYSADLLLSNSSQPTGSGFDGTVLDPAIAGQGSLTFTASDPGGPGVYRVQVSIDGTKVYDATPNTNGGTCAPVGTDAGSGALMFDSQQPCRQSESVVVPIDTTKFPNGHHELSVVVIDAAGNLATVTDQQISIANPTSAALTPTTALSALTPTYAFALDRSTRALNGAVSRQYSDSALRFSGTLETQNGVAVPGVEVSVWSAPANGSTFTRITKTTTARDGSWALRVPKGLSRMLRVVAGNNQPTVAPSAVSVTETVTPSLSLRVRHPASAKLDFTGRMTYPSADVALASVQIEVWSTSGWQKVGGPVPVGAHGKFRFVYDVSPVLMGHHFRFRASTPATSQWPAAASAAIATTVR